MGKQKQINAAKEGFFSVNSQYQTPLYHRYITITKYGGTVEKNVMLGGNRNAPTNNQKKKLKTLLNQVC